MLQRDASTLAGNARTGPRLVALDSILLPEAGSLYVGNPYTPVVDPFDGSFYVPDLFSGRVLRFGRDGRLIRAYGRAGDGPGEFRSAGSTFVLDDSTLVVHDTGLGRLTLLDRRTGAFRGTRSFPWGPSLTPPVVEDGYAWMAVSDRAFKLHGSVARWDVVRDTLEFFGPMPDEYWESANSQNWTYANQMLRGQLAVHGGRIFRGWQSYQDLFVLDHGGAVVDTIDIPVLRRLGVPDDIRERMDVGRMGLEEQITSYSRLRQLYVFPDGRVAFTHHDQKAIRLRPFPIIAARVWVGVVSADLKRACVDTELPVSMDARSMETFRGDTLFQLDRRIPPGTETVETWIRMFQVQTSECEWVPIG